MSALMMLFFRLRLYAITIITLLFSFVCCYSVLPGEINWESIPTELRGVTIRKLLEQGDIKSFLNAYVASPAFKKAIDEDPVLNGTFGGIKKMQKPLEELLLGEGAAISTLEVLMNDLSSIGKELSGDPGIHAQVINNLGIVVFRTIEKSINGSINDTSTTSRTLYYVGKNLPREYLARFDTVLTHLIQKTGMQPSAQYIDVASGLKGLAQNSNIPTSLTLERIKPIMELMRRQMLPDAAVAVDDALLTLVSRQDLDKKTIEYFKEIENNPAMQRDIFLYGALIRLKKNPAYLGK